MKEEFRVKLFDETNMQTLEKKLNMCLKQQQEERFLYDHLDFTIQHEHFIGNMIFKFNNLIIPSQERKDYCKIKTLSAATLEKLEKKISKLIGEMQEKKYRMIDSKTRINAKGMYFTFISFNYQY